MENEPIVGDIMDSQEAIFAESIKPEEEGNEGQPKGPENSDSSEALNDDPGKANEANQSITDEGKEPAISDPKPGALPETLKPFEKTLSNKGLWTGNPEESLAKTLKSYSELETHLGEKGREIGLMGARVEEVNRLISGDISAINKAREAKGLNPLPVESKTYEQQLGEVSEMRGLIEALTDENRAAEAFAKLQKMVADRETDLKFKSELDKRIPKDSFQKDYKEAARQNANNLALQNPGVDIKATFNNIVQDGEIAPLLESFGVTAFDLVSTPERAQAAFKLAQLVSNAKNIDNIVEQKVQAALEEKRLKSNSSPNGKTNRGSNNSQKPETMEDQSYRELTEWGIGVY